MRDKRAKFLQLAHARVNRTIKELRLVGNLANRSAYEYEADEVKKIFRALQKELDAARTRFEGTGGKRSLEFSLE